MDRPTAGGGRSLTTCCKVASVLAEGEPCTLADVAQWEERGASNAEATSSRLVIRSNPLRVCPCTPRPPDTASDRVLARGHSRSGIFTSLAQQVLRAPVYEAGGRTFESCTRYQHRRSSSMGRAAAFKAEGSRFDPVDRRQTSRRRQGPHAERSVPSDRRVHFIFISV